jgi:alpha-D-ribose 1-methylphosphonate 5-triphosphate synthase subunit PhnG
MNLVELRERLKAIDVALSEVQKAVSRAGLELIKANVGVGDMMGENMKAKSKPRAKKAAQPAANGQEPDSSSMVEPVKRRGRPHKQQEEKHSNSEAVDEASV